MVFFFAQSKPNQEMTPKEKADGVVAKHKTEMVTLLKDAQRLLKVPRSLNHRATRMLTIVDELAALVAPVAACKKGCDHCCYQSVVISSWEALRIAQATKHKIETNFPGYSVENHSKDEMIEKYKGQACPFLKDHACSIYAVRPMICRTHMSLADDPTPCDIINNPGAEVPYFNFTDLNTMQGVMFYQGNCKLGDIRDFFPVTE